MKKISFLCKLYKEEKIKEVDPSLEIKQAYLIKSAKSLSSAKTLSETGNLEDAVALTYYSMYHCLTALLFRIGIKCENHAGAILLLKEVFGIDNTQISFAKKERVDKQYYVDFQITKQEVTTAIKIAEEFNARIQDFIEKISENSIKEYHHNTLILIGAKEK